MRMPYNYTVYQDCPEATQKSKNYNEAIAKLSMLHFAAILFLVIWVFYSVSDFCSSGQVSTLLISVLVSIAGILILLFLFFGSNPLNKAACKKIVIEKNVFISESEKKRMIQSIKEKSKDEVFRIMFDVGVYYLLGLVALYTIALMIYASLYFVILLIASIGLIVWRAVTC